MPSLNNAPKPSTSPAHRSTCIAVVSLGISHLIMKSNKEAEAEVRSWGYNHVFTWTDSANGTSVEAVAVLTTHPLTFTDVHAKPTTHRTPILGRPRTSYYAAGSR